MQALVHLPLILQTQALSLVALPLCVLVPQLPPDLLLALVRRHLFHGALDISNQLRLHEFDTRYTRGMRELVKKLPFKTLCAELQTLPALTSLSLSDNNLLLADAAPLATFFASCTSKLESLAMSKNTQPKFAVAVLPALTACTALTCLNLSGCRLPQSCAAPLGDVLCATCRLKRLVLNDAIDMSLESLTHPLSSLTTLTSLSIRENRFSEGFTELARVLRRLGALQELDVSGNAPHCDSFACVVASAVLLPALRTLRLDNSSVSMQRPTVPTMSFPSNKLQGWLELYKVEVQSTHSVASTGTSTAIAPAGPAGTPTKPSGDGSVQIHADHACTAAECFDSIPPDFKSVRFPLKELYMSHMHGVGIDWLMAISTAQMAWKSNRLRNVGSFFTPWRTAVSPPLWEAVQAPDAPDDAPVGGPLNSPWSIVAMLENLEVLDISSPEYSFKYPHTGINSSCEFIFQLPKLRDFRARNLDVKHRSFSLVDLSEGLSSRLSQKAIAGLTALDWSENSVTLGDLRAVCSISTLQRLVLQGCGLGVEGATVLAEHVSQLTALHTLDLAGNKLTGSGASALLHGAGELSSLKVVDVGGGSGVVQAVSELRSEGVLGSGVQVLCSAGQCR